jgi:hypothetical protein
MLAGYCPLGGEDRWNELENVGGAWRGIRNECEGSPTGIWVEK